MDDLQSVLYLQDLENDVRPDAADDDDGGALVVADDATSKGDASSKDGMVVKECGGCLRENDAGKEAVDEEPGVEWGLPDGRGSWCKMCFTLWRIMLKHKLPLSFLYAWLREHDNMIDWNVMIVVYLSLRKEGRERVTKLDIDNRTQALLHCCALLGLPLRGFAARVLVDDYVPAGCPDVGRLLSVIMPGGESRVAYLENRDGSLPQGCTSVSMPPTLMLHLGNPILYSSDPKDVSIIGLIFGGGVDAVDSSRAAQEARRVLQQTAIAIALPKEPSKAE